MSRKCFPAQLDQLSNIVRFIQEGGQEYHLPSSLMNHVVLAVEEVVVNIMDYAYPDRLNGIIEIEIEEYKNEKNGLCITIKDQGLPFNPIRRFHAFSPPTLSKDTPSFEQVELGGYGIPLLIGLMDGVDYQRIKDENVLYLIKYF